MPIISREARAKERKRIMELLEQGLATKAITARLGVSAKKVSRARKLMQESKSPRS